jgi:hypothetical protein
LGNGGSDAVPGADTPVVFVSDPTAEAEQVAHALRAAGYAVVDVPLSMLVARVAVQHPRVVLVDADSHGALDIVARMRELPQADDVHVLFVAVPGGAIASLDEALAHEGSGWSARPIDVASMVRQIESLTGGARERPSSLPPPSTEGGAARPSVPPLVVRRGSSGLAESATFSEPPMPASKVSIPKLLSLAPPVSRELQNLLAEAERRIPLVSDEDMGPSPEQELEAVLPAELLAALDEPLDVDDETDSSVGRHPSTSGRGTRDRTTDGGPPRTSVAATGIGATPATGDGEEPAGVKKTDVPPRDEPPLRTRSAASSALGLRSSGPPESGERFDPTVAAGRGGLASAPSRAGPWAGPRPRGTRPEAEMGEALRIVGRAIAARSSGALCLAHEAIERRIALREGDVVTCASAAEDESLMAFLGVRGDLPRETVRRLASRFPPFGRHAGAALVARGYLLQDQMWPILRAHAEWLLGRALQMPSARATFESDPVGRLASEPSVFGGATGAEVLVEGVRRVIAPTNALERLGGAASRLGPGSSRELLDECGLTPSELEIVRGSAGATIGEVLARARDEDFVTSLLALTHLGVLEVLRAVDHASGAVGSMDPQACAIDAAATRERVQARLQLVEDGDYFAVLGVPRDATGYEVKRAFLELRRAFEPSRLLSPEVADLADGVRLIASVLEEAYEILKDSARRERYRKAIEGSP